MIAVDQIVLHCLVGAFLLSRRRLPDAGGFSAFSRPAGHVTSPGALIHLLVQQYHVFVAEPADSDRGDGDRGAATCSGATGTGTGAPCGSRRYCSRWAAVGIVIFGLSNLRFPQYFALVLRALVPAVWTEVWGWDRPFR